MKTYLLGAGTVLLLIPAYIVADLLNDALRTPVERIGVYYCMRKARR